MQKRRWFFWALALVLAMGAACAAKDADAADVIVVPKQTQAVWDYGSTEALSVAPGARVAMVFMEPRLAYWDAVRAGAEHAIGEINARCGYEGDDAVTLQVDAARDATDMEDQINRIDALIAENPTVICIAAIDETSCAAQLEAARDNSIPVIALDSGLASDLISATCATDNPAAGYAAAEKLCEAIGNAGDVALILHTPTARTAIDRRTGAERCFAAHADVHCVAVLEQSEDLEEALQTLLAEHPDLAGLLCSGERGAELALDVIEKSGRSDVQLVGFDAGKAQMAAVRSGTECGMLAQNPRGMGYAAVVAGLLAAAGKPVDAQIDTGFCWVDRSNLDTGAAKAYLYE